MCLERPLRKINQKKVVYYELVSLGCIFFLRAGCGNFLMMPLAKPRDEFFISSGVVKKRAAKWRKKGCKFSCGGMIFENKYVLMTNKD